jgi:hypothetical protein
MSNWDFYNFSRDLSDFILLLQKYDIPVDISEFSILDSKLQSNQVALDIELENVPFTVDKKISGTVPIDIGLLQIFFSHKCHIDSSIDEKIMDPIIEFDFQIHIKGYDSSMNEYVNWWHLDKNIKSSSPKFTHPYYHFQSGGNEIESVNTGDLVLLGSPRIPHPPMDLFLGFHFILNNFYSSKDYLFVDQILEDNTYKAIMMRAQKRMWENYFNAFSSGSSHTDFTLKNIFPLYT